MGGQACVLYGAAEFSRDIDLAVISSDLAPLRRALEELQAERIAVPPFEAEYLEKGHAIHFRCRHPEAEGLRIDIMSRFRGMDDFEQIWGRKSELKLSDNLLIAVMSLPDLIKAKKTQRDKDWPMIRRLAENHYVEFSNAANPERINFWLQELRTPSLLSEVTSRFPMEAKELSPTRAAVAIAMTGGTEDEITVELRNEELQEREADRIYWIPLRAELEQLRKKGVGPK